MPLGKYSGGLYESAVSVASTMESSFSSSMMSTSTEVTNRSRKKSVCYICCHKGNNIFAFSEQD